MNRSLKIFSIRGIDIKIHLTFPLILIWAAFQYGFIARGGVEGMLFGIITVSFLFIFVTLHELGHSFAARYFGVPVQQITLLPIGGVAQLKYIPRNPVQEFIIAIAGPSVNILAAIFLSFFAIIFNSPWLNPLTVVASQFTLTFDSIIGYVYLYNIVLAFFNLLPAFPMDGGRILRSLLAMRLDYGKATQVAVRIGQTLAIFMGIYGIVRGGFFMVLIALFVFNGAAQEYRLVKQSERLRGLTVKQVYTAQAVFLSPYDTVQRALSLKLLGWQSNFPVFYADNMIGLLSERDLMETMSRRGASALVGEVMSSHIQPVSLTLGLFDVQQRMLNERITALPVMEGSQFLGMITWRHLDQAIQRVSPKQHLSTPIRSA